MPGRGTGFLKAATQESVNDYAAIGGNNGEDGGEITIHGGRVTADTEETSDGAAGGPAEAYCQTHASCVFVEEGQN